MKSSKTQHGGASNAGSRPKKEAFFGTDIGTDPRTGKQFELRESGLFIPLPGEFESEPTPPEEVPIAVAEKGLFVPRSMQTHFQRDFDKKVKLDPLFGERVKTSEASINSARRVFASHAVGSKDFKTS